jgi:hypothetical protein
MTRIEPASTSDALSSPGGGAGEARTPPGDVARLSRQGARWLGRMGAWVLAIWCVASKTGPSFSHIVLPIAFSLTLHGLLLAAVLSATWSSAGGRGGGGYARAEVVISLPASSQAPQPPSPGMGGMAGGGSETFSPAHVDGSLPRLQGFSTPGRSGDSVMPVLRSAAGGADVAAADLRSQDDSAIGATFGGLGTRQASSVVYVVDASGAMITSLQFVLEELERSVRNLSSAQKFQVVLFRARPAVGGGRDAGGAGGGALYDVFAPPGMASPGLVSATPVNKAALSAWLKDIRPMGRSNPIDGLRRGLDFKPDAIFLLSRSIRRSGGELAAEPPGGVWGRPTNETMEELDRLNPRRRLGGNRRVVINAIQFLEEDPSGTMQAIGHEHGDGPGSYSVLTLEALRVQRGQ